MEHILSGVGLEDLDGLLDDYWRELQLSPLADKSIEDYYYFALCFVRWVGGDFTPGGHVVRANER